MKNLVSIIAVLVSFLSLSQKSPDFSMYEEVDFYDKKQIESQVFYVQPDETIVYTMDSYSDTLGVVRVLTEADYLLSVYGANHGLVISDFFGNGKEMSEFEYAFELPDGGLMRVGRYEVSPSEIYLPFVSVIYADGNER